LQSLLEHVHLELAFPVARREGHQHAYAPNPGSLLRRRFERRGEHRAGGGGDDPAPFGVHHVARAWRKRSARSAPDYAATLRNIHHSSGSFFFRMICLPTVSM
jgi:hypothetical protein